MNKKSQLLELLKSSIENEELRAKIVDATNSTFTDFEAQKDEAIESRDKAKAKLKLSNDKLSEIQTNLSLEDDFTLEDIQSKIKKVDNSDEIEAKYKGDIEQLRTALSDKENEMLDLSTKFDDTMFTNAISQSGIMNGYVSDTMARNNIIAMYKENTVFEDGNIYAKDTATGKVATDLTTGAKLGLDSVMEHINSGLDSMYLTTDIKANGGGTPPNNGNIKTGKKFNDYNSTELVAMNRDNPSMYQALKNAQ